MEDEEEIQTHHSVTVAATPPQNSITLALPIQQPRTAAAVGGGREDCWSDGATSTLIDAWGERYMQLSRGNLKQNHWIDVAEIVTSREKYTKSAKTNVQCKNRIDTLKKKYKTEKAKIASGQGPSKWVFYHRLDQLLSHNNGNAMTPPPPPPTMFMPMDSDSLSSEPADSSDGFPPETFTRKRPRGKGKTRGDSMRELSQAILEFGEAYQQTESSKLQQLVEMEKHRMEITKDLELKRMQLFMKTQLEISQLKHGPGANSKTSD